jgi:hypothetical protein
VNPERSMLAYVAILDSSHPPKPPQTAFLLYVNKQNAGLYRSWLIEFLTHHVLFMAGTTVQSVGISITVYEQRSKYSQLVFSGVL